MLISERVRDISASSLKISSMAKFSVKEMVEKYYKVCTKQPGSQWR